MASPSFDRRMGLVGNTAFKAPVAVVATGNITLSGEQTIDGIAVLASNAAGRPDRVLCVNQTDATQNGIWDVSTSTWTRSLDANGNYDLARGTTVGVARGALYEGTYWHITAADPITVGSTSITWERSFANSLSAISFVQGGTGAASRSALEKMREVVSVLDYYNTDGTQVAGNGVQDDTSGLNRAATYARSIGATLLINPTASFYAISSQVDLTGIKYIIGRNALMKTTSNSAYAAVKVGHQTPGQVLQNYDIWVEVQNFTDGSTTAGNRGIQVEGLRSGRLTYFVRGFDEGVYFNGAGATSVNWTDNHFYPLQVFNNGSHHHLDLAGASYFNSNQFHGGLYYLGTATKKSGRAPFKITHGGTTSVQVHGNTVHDSCINVDGNSYHADNGLLMYIENTSSVQFNSFSFRNCRYESNNLGAFATDPYLVNIAVNTNAAAKYEIDIELLSGLQRWLVFTGDQKSNSVYVRTAANWSMSGSMARQRIVNRPMSPYQVNGNVYVQGRTIYDTTLTAVAATITNGVAARTTQARGDGNLYSSGSTVIVGKKYKRSTSAQALFLQLPDSTTLTVIAYDSAGAVLTGTAPWYVMMTGARNAAFGGVNVYQGNSNWVWIHPDVDSFFIGAGPWTASARRVLDINAFIEVTYGDNLLPVNDDDTGPNFHAASAVVQSYFPVGMAIDGDASNGWRCTFALKTTAANVRVATDTTIDLASVTGVNSGDMIGVELDTVLVTLGSIRQIHWTTVNGAPAGSTVTLTVALPAGVAIGRTVFINRWAAR